MSYTSKIWPGEPIIHDGNYQAYVGESEWVGGNLKAKGLIPRSLSEHPVGCFKGIAAPFDTAFKEVPKSDWEARCKENAAQEMQLSDMRMRGVSNGGQMIPSLDQNGQGYCWMYSTTMAIMMTRMKMRLPCVRLSAHAGACMVKNFRDEGGWCGLSMEWHTKTGVPSVDFWKEKSMSRSYDKPETWANAARHKVLEGWVDMTSEVYDRHLSFNQVVSLLLCGIPVAADFNWWGHSVCLLDAIWVDGTIAIRGINSWTDGWGEKGMFILQGNKAVPDSAVAPRVIYASAA